jgi:hypothetical protein
MLISSLGVCSISGGPAWINSDHYEINAKAEGAQSWGVMNGPMLRMLLEEGETRAWLIFYFRCISTGARCESSLSIRKLHFSGMLCGG